MAFRTTFNARAIGSKIKKIVEQQGIEALSQQVLKDSNFYAREDSGQLIASSVRASDTSKGQLVWDTSYAKKAYYTGMPSKDVNKNAELMWFEVAKTKHLKDWRKILQKILDRRV